MTHQDIYLIFGDIRNGLGAISLFNNVVESIYQEEVIPQGPLGSEDVLRDSLATITKQVWEIGRKVDSIEKWLRHAHSRAT